jgi:hypothetical protein
MLILLVYVPIIIYAIARLVYIGITHRKAMRELREDMHKKVENSTTAEQYHEAMYRAIKEGRNYVDVTLFGDNIPQRRHFCEGWQLPILQEKVAKWEELEKQEKGDTDYGE